MCAVTVSEEEAQLVRIYDDDFGLVAIDLDLIRDLAGFTGKDVESCVERLRSYTSREMGAAWRRANPQTAREMRDFYARTDFYLWELSKWHASEQYKPYLAAVDALIARQPAMARPLSVLDYGSGIGTTGLRFAAASYDVTIADVPGITFEFAKYRLRRRGVPFHTIDVVDDIPAINGQFDAIVCFDVLEHVPRPERVWIELEKHLASSGIVALVASYDAQPDFAVYHLRQNYRKWGQGRWDIFMNGRGFRRCGDMLLERRRLPGAVVARLRYWFWRSTGLYVRHLPRHL
jgi:SAM-dependent methyltransferase